MSVRGLREGLEPRTECGREHDGIRRRRLVCGSAMEAPLTAFLVTSSTAVLSLVP